MSWMLRSNLASHPFHIHVNPFQVVKIIAPDGTTDVSAPVLWIISPGTATATR